MSNVKPSSEGGLFKYNSLIVSLAISDLKLRYRNSFLGFLWSILEPLLMLGVLFYVFGYVFPSTIKDFPIFLLLGLIMWYMFARSTQNGLASLVSKAAIVSKIYFPREIVPTSSTITAFIMMALEFIAFGVFAIALNFIPPATSLLLPLVLVIEFILCLGTSLALSVANVYFRDVQYIWAVILQAGFFLTPIFYNLESFPSNIRDILYLNPMTGLLEIAHSVAIYNEVPSLSDLAYPVISSISILVIGYFIFKKFEARAVELL